MKIRQVNTYETTDLKVNDNVVSVSYDPEELKLGSTDVSDTLKRFSGVNEIFLIRLIPFKYDSVSLYGDDVANGLISRGNYVNVHCSDISEDTFGTTKNLNVYCILWFKNLSEYG